MATGPPEDWVKTYNTLKEFHDLSYVKLDEGIKQEEQGHKDVALSKYEEGLRLIDLALELQIECPANADYSWEKACVMVQKLRTTRKEVLSRIADVQVVLPQPEPDPYLAPPPTYEEAMSAPSSMSPITSIPPVINNNALTNISPVPSTSTTVPTAGLLTLLPSSSRPAVNAGPMTYSELGEALNNLKVQTNTQSAQVIFTYENVKIYFIRPNGTVTAPSEPSTLRVLQLDDGANEVAKFYLQVGEWFYPLVPNVSPCLRADYGAYILPDVHSGEDGAAVGLVFPPEYDDSVFELLEDLLGNVVVVEPKSPPRSPRVRRDDSRSARFSKGLVSGDDHDHHHRHHKHKRLGRGGRHRHHRRGYDNLDDQSQGTSRRFDSESTLVDPNDDSKKHHKHHRKHLGLRHRRHRRGDKHERPPPYDEIGKEADELSDDDEDDEDEKKTVVSDDDKDRKSDRDKRSRRNKRYVAGFYQEQRDKIERGAQVISNGLIKGAEKASQLLNSSTPKILEKVTPEPTPRQVPPSVAKSVEVARNVSGTAVTVTGYIAGKVGNATMALGRYLAPHVQKHGTRLLSAAGGMDEKAASDRVGGILEVTAGAVEGFSTVYSGLEQSAGILGNSLANNTVQLVQHKYGQPMGEVTGNTIHMVGNVYTASHNVKFLTPKGLAKRTAKDAGKAVIFDARQELKSAQQQQQQLNSNNFSSSTEKLDLDKFKTNQFDKPGPSKQ